MDDIKNENEEENIRESKDNTILNFMHSKIYLALI